MKRFYFALTNACNRSCDFCSCYSRPGKKTFLPFEKYKEYLEGEFNFEVQLEGGEPFLHPNLEEMIHYAQDTDRCDRIILGTNTVLLPYGNSKKESIENIKNYFLKFNSPFILKPSINYSLIEKDPFHLDKCEIIKDSFSELKKLGDYGLKFNVRRRKNKDDDQWLVDELKKRNLEEVSNIFFLQRYGYAKGDENLELPYVIKNPVDFHLIDPEGNDYGMDLIARSNAMEDMK